MYYTYSIVEDSYYNYKQHYPMFFVMTNDNKYYSAIVIFESEKLGVVEIELKYAKIIYLLAMNFHYVYIDYNIDYHDIAIIDEKT